MTDRLTFLRKYDDVQIWLAMLSFNSEDDFTNVTKAAKIKTAQHFNISANAIFDLTSFQEDNYSASQEAILTYYFEYLRNNPAFGKWHSKVKD